MSGGLRSESWWECNAPQFVDFTMPDEDGDVDKYFDYDHENGVPIDFGVIPDAHAQEVKIPGLPTRQSARNTPKRTCRAKTPDDKKTKNTADTPKAHTPDDVFKTPTETPMNRRDTLTVETPSQVSHHPRTRSMGASATPSARRRSRSMGTISASARRRSRSFSNRPASSTAPSSKPVEPKANHAVASTSVSQTREPSSVRRSPRAATIRKAASVEALPKHQTNGNHVRAGSATRAKKADVPLKRSSTPSKRRTNSVERSTSMNRSSKNNHGLIMPKLPPPMKPKMTMAVTPTFMKRKPTAAKTSVKNAEQIQMDKIKELRSELAKKKRLAEESYRKAKATLGVQPVRSVQPLTKVEQFSFATDKRVKDNRNEANQPSPKEFTAMLRKAVEPAAEVHRGPTVPQPFDLHGSKRKRDSAETAPQFESMAQKVMSFTTKTPDRFRSKPSGSKDVWPSKRRRSRSCGAKLTIPQTPHLESRKRHRPTNVISHMEQEELDAQEIKRYKFTANPLNKKIFERQNIGVTKLPSKETTVPLNIKLRTEMRQKHHAQRLSVEVAQEFHAQPIPKGILDGPTGIKPVKGHVLTIPESPAFALKNRLRSHSRLEEVEIPQMKFPPKRAPNPDTPAFQPKIEHKVVETQPFSFDQRDQAMIRQKEMKIQRVYEEEKKAREFHANPLPALSPDPVLPKKAVKPITKPEPFDMMTNVRGAQKADKWFHQIEEELKDQREKASTFKAKPSNVLYKEPFIPKKSTRALTDVTAFELNTQRRHEERSQWEAGRAKEEQMRAMMQEAAERQRQEEKEREVHRLRQEAVHKPNPVRHYRPVRVIPSDAVLTRPQSPRFSKRLRERSQDSSL